MNTKQWIGVVVVLALIVLVAVVVAQLGDGTIDDLSPTDGIGIEDVMTNGGVQESGSTGVSPQVAAGLAGSYAGVLPCNDCVGTDTNLAIRSNGTFTLTERYLGTPSAVPPSQGNMFVSGGVWRVDNGSLALALSQTGEARSYRIVSNNELRQLDQQGREIQSDRNHSLTRAAATAAAPETLIGRTWNWVRTESSGDTVVRPAEADAFTVAFTTGDTVTVETDCATYTGTYRTSSSNEINITVEAATDECSGASQAAVFVKMLNDSDRYYFATGGLYLGLPFSSGYVAFQ